MKIVLHLDSESFELLNRDFVPEIGAVIYLDTGEPAEIEDIRYLLHREGDNADLELHVFLKKK